MSVDLDRVIFSSSYNSFKNNSVLTTGSISFPTSLTAGQIGTVETTVTLDVEPVFSEFIAYFTEQLELSTYGTGVYGNPQWYPGVVSASGGVGLWVTTAPHVGVTDGLINVIVNGRTITVQAVVQNPYGSTISLTPLTVPFAFTSYTLAN